MPLHAYPANNPLAIVALLSCLLISALVLDSTAAPVDPQEYSNIQQIRAHMQARTDQIKALTHSGKMQRMGNGLLEPVPNQVLSAAQQAMLTEENADRRRLFEFVAKYSDPPISPMQAAAEFAKTWSSEQPSQQSQPQSVNVILRLHGSNTIGAVLAPKLAMKFLERKDYRDIRAILIRAQEQVIQGIKPGVSVPDAIEIKAHGSDTAFDETASSRRVGLKGGYCHIGMSSRRIKPTEVDELRKAGLGDLTSRASEHVIALDGVAIIVNPTNPLTELRVEDLRRIFRGETREWRQVPGGRLEGVIDLYVRDKQSGPYDTFIDQVLQGTPLDFNLPQIRKAPDGRPGFENSDELAAGVATAPDGIGFVGWPYVRVAKPLAIRHGQAREIPPTRHTIRTEDYPLSQRLYFYVVANSSALANEFIGFTLSREGQEVVREAGFVDLTPHALGIDSTNDALLRNPAVPAAYKALIQDAERVDITFRFETNRADMDMSLDNLAFRDLERLTELPGVEKAEIRLLGFADSRGSEQHNRDLSIRRAQSVAQELRRRGLQVGAIQGFGEEKSLLLDPDEATEESYRKNRRVEVWLKRR